MSIARSMVDVLRDHVVAWPPGLFNAHYLRTSESEMSQVERDRCFAIGVRIPEDLNL
jgi:hypothetical protein